MRSSRLASHRAATWGSSITKPANTSGFSEAKWQKKRNAIKSKAKSARRAIRYEEPRIQPVHTPTLTTELPIFESFAVRFALAAKGKEIKVIENILGRGWSITPFGSSSSAFSKVSAASTRLSVDQAWANTHRLKADKGNILEAEPLFQVRLRDSAEADVPGVSAQQRASGLIARPAQEGHGKS